MSSYRLKHVELQKAYFAGLPVPQREAQRIVLGCLTKRLERAQREAATFDDALRVENDLARRDVLSYKCRLLAHEVDELLSLIVGRATPNTY